MRVTKTFGAVALVLAMVGTARAGNPPPPKEAKDIACLVGSWRGMGSMTMGKDKMDGVKLSWSCIRPPAGGGHAGAVAPGLAPG